MARRLHSRHFSSWLCTAVFDGEAESAGQGQVAALRQLSTELDNMQAALAASLTAADRENLLACARCLPLGLELLCDFRLLQDCLARILERAAELGDAQLRLPALLGLAASLRRLGQAQAAIALCQEAVELAELHEQDALRARALRLLGQCHIAGGQVSLGRTMLLAGLELAEACHDRHELDLLLNTLGTLDFRQGRHESARQQLARAQEVVRGAGNLEAEARTLTNLALLDVRAGKLADARSLFERALAMETEIGDRRSAAICLANLGSIASDASDHHAARAYFQQALELIRQTGERSIQATLLGNLAMAAREEEDYMLAATLLGQAFELHRELGNQLGQAEILRFMAIVSLLQQDPGQSAAYLIRALDMSQEFGAQREIAVSAGLAGTLLARQGDLQRGAALLHGALHQEELNSFRYEDDVRSILHHGLEEVTGRPGSSGLSAEETTRARQTGQALSLDELGALTSRTLRERFANWRPAA